MPLPAEPTAARGEITLQPSYFTSSIYVDALRGDISALIALYSHQYIHVPQPFELFKNLWKEQGWNSLHLRVYDARARQSFLSVTERLIAERLTDNESPVTRVVALFSLYTFHTTQPSSSAPVIYSAPDILLPIDTYESTIALPSVLGEPPLLRLRPYVTHILTKLLDAKAFRLLPHSSLRAQNPSRLPREMFTPEIQLSLSVGNPTGALDTQGAGSSAPPKKKGRPSKHDKMRKARDALQTLDKYVDRNTVMLLDQKTTETSATPQRQTEPAHIVFGQAPHGSLDSYVAKKNELLITVQPDTLYTDSTSNASDTGNQAQSALERVNEAVLAQLKQIDAMAAEQGLEVGGEGGEKTGLARVERAVEELRQRAGPGAHTGILGLLEGAGTETGSASSSS